MLSAMLLALVPIQAAAPQAVPPAAPRPSQPPATMVVEPVAAAIAGWDADGDARTARAEMEAGVRRSFAAVTNGGAGSIGYIAFADWAERWLGDRNALPSPFEVDADADDRITLTELEGAFARIFTRLDRNGDGALSRAELLTIRAQVGGGAERRRGRRGGQDEGEQPRR